jgi:hypothetical protein
MTADPDQPDLFGPLPEPAPSADQSPDLGIGTDLQPKRTRLRLLALDDPRRPRNRTAVKNSHPPISRARRMTTGC